MARAFNAAVTETGRSVTAAHLGEQIVVEVLTFEVLAVSDPDGLKDINSQSMVLRLTTPGTSILFLGDLTEAGGQRLLASEFGGNRLRSDYVQMAHHGQRGVSRKFYEAVGAKYALWPTPHYLYDLPQPWMPNLFR